MVTLARRRVAVAPTHSGWRVVRILALHASRGRSTVSKVRGTVPCPVRGRVGVAAPRSCPCSVSACCSIRRACTAIALAQRARAWRMSASAARRAAWARSTRRGGIVLDTQSHSRHPRSPTCKVERVATQFPGSAADSSVHGHTRHSSESGGSGKSRSTARGAQEGGSGCACDNSFANRGEAPSAAPESVDVRSERTAMRAQHAHTAPKEPSQQQESPYSEGPRPFVYCWVPNGGADACRELMIAYPTGPYPRFAVCLSTL